MQTMTALRLVSEAINTVEREYKYLRKEVEVLDRLRDEINRRIIVHVGRKAKTK